MEEMNTKYLIGTRVQNKDYGEGVISDYSDGKIAVEFSDCKKKYSVKAFSLGGLQLLDNCGNVDSALNSSVTGINGLTKEQNDCIEYTEGDLLVRGVAGSGKSYVIMKRALKLIADNPDSSLIIFTYTNSLVHYMRELFDEVPNGALVEISTVDKYCKDLYSKMIGRQCYIIQSWKRRQFIEQSIAEYKLQNKKKNAILDAEIDFWADEIAWIKGKCITNCEEYIAADRTGRGAEIRVARNVRPIVWSILEKYEKKLASNRLIDWEGIYVYLSRHTSKIPADYLLDYILVDEAQDMNVGKLRVLKSLAKNSITIAADIAQKIYKSTFTWKETGIDISGRASKALTQSFRSTKQIVSLAEDLIKIDRENSTMKGEYTEEVLPSKEGQQPLLIAASSQLAEEQIIMELVKNELKNNEHDVIGFIVRDKRTGYHWLKRFEKSNLRCQIVDNDREYMITEPGIKIVTAHSSKGLEFDVVMIPFFEEDNYPLKPWYLEQTQEEEFMVRERSLVYVAMTRAKRQLVITYRDEYVSEFVKKLDRNKYQLIEV